MRPLLVAVAGLVAVVAGCAADDDADTLEPLPIEGGTAAPSTDPASSSASSASSVSTASTTARTAATPTTVAPVGDWDGARFDVGTIATVAELGGFRTIGFDRYSYTSPELGTVDAGALVAEPLVAWWRVNPFSNVRVQLRTFVLDPDVEVLVLDEGDRPRACAEPPSPAPPSPSWEEADATLLDDPTAVAAIATLTYSPSGHVTRIRFTAGC